ncbi:MAG: CRISPR-associated helicase Cas3' [Bacteroidales bacterium]|nr:CRISPR-associated helicase Cas3' [Porphyromonas sp.]MDD6934970.1 CRISPR-associated helicase Cas3' [Bacteroidales bacterium]MDY3102578.1 CRISPR-associated helicase Cas3' [Porphyromonas sp.]
MEETPDFIAHVDADGKTQSVEDHAEGVARLCSEFCAQIDPDWSEVGTLLGLLHDQGKYQRAFQKYIRHSSGLADHGPARAPHSMAGAIHAYSIFKERDKALALTLSHCIGGHHRGLYDSVELRNALKMADNKAYCRNMLQDAPEVAVDLEKRIAQLATLPDIMEIDEEDRPLFVRMLFSALIDADRLDTEAFMNKERALLRTQSKCADVPWSSFRDKLKAKTDNLTSDTPINRARTDFLEKCRAHGRSHDPNIYTLFLPTGGGKTLSSMAWALESAIRNHSSRIIYVIPYTSIITQTAEVFKNIFGEEYVLEHHSELDVSDNEEYDRWKLLTENWDAPIIITTNVQMFESLYAHQTSRCRKLHNICNSVIVFDEVQMFPSALLNPMLRAIESLSLRFATNILLCTATQPNFTQSFETEGRESSNFYTIQVEIENIVPYDKELFSAFERVRFHKLGNPQTIATLAEELTQQHSALCIVNTRADAGRLYDEVVTLGRPPEEIVHLSRMMCSLHIRRRIAYIKERLSAGLPVIVISTQLIEAGVDIDFPVVYRAHSGLDSIIQAGGRCNREGRRNSGDVYIFDLKDGSTPGEDTKQGRQASLIIYENIGEAPLNPNDSALIHQYYMEYYGNQVNSFDKRRIEHYLWSDQANHDLEWDFETASKKFRLIENEGITDIYVPYEEEGEELISKLSRNTILNRREFRILQKLRVGVRKKDFETLYRQGVLKEIRLGELPIWILTYGSPCYDEARGLRCEDVWTDEIVII